MKCANSSAKPSSFNLEAMRDDDEPVPEPMARVEYLEVQHAA
jgi:hypothetical protein